MQHETFELITINTVTETELHKVWGQNYSKYFTKYGTPLENGSIRTLLRFPWWEGGT